MKDHFQLQPPISNIDKSVQRKMLIFMRALLIRLTNDDVVFLQYSSCTSEKCFACQTLIPRVPVRRFYALCQLIKKSMGVTNAQLFIVTLIIRQFPHCVSLSSGGVGGILMRPWNSLDNLLRLLGKHQSKKIILSLDGQSSSKKILLMFEMLNKYAF